MDERPSFGGGDSRPPGKQAMGRGIAFVKSGEILNPSTVQEVSNDGDAVDSPTPQSQSSGPPALMSITQKAKFPSEQDPGISSDKAFIPKWSGRASQPGYQGRGEIGSSLSSSSFKVSDARPILSKEEYFTLWKSEKNSQLAKFRKLVYEIMSLKTYRPNAIDKIMSASNRVPIKVEFNTEPVKGGKGSSYFLCHVFMDTVMVGSGQGMKVRDSKGNAYEAALQKLFMPYLRVVPLDPKTKELQGSRQEFTNKPQMPSQVPLAKNTNKIAPSRRPEGNSSQPHVSINSQCKETNFDVASMKRKAFDYKPLKDFVIVEPQIPIPDCTPVHTLRRSADFNHMLLEYEYFFKGEPARCVLKLENQTLADVSAATKIIAKNIAAAQALTKLRGICWIIKTKQAVDSDTKISKEEMLNELNETGQSSDVIGNENVGHKLLSKMGWVGGGVGKDGDGIAEPVSLKSVFNREGLGLSATKGITDEFRRRVRELIEEYAVSNNQDDLVFACDFRLDERQIIHDICRRLNLKSKSRGKGEQRYLCVRRKRTAFELFDHIMASGGETARYQLVPPGADSTIDQPHNPSNATNNPQHQQQWEQAMASHGPSGEPPGAYPWHKNTDLNSRNIRNENGNRNDQKRYGPQKRGNSSPDRGPNWGPKNGPNSSYWCSPNNGPGFSKRGGHGWNIEESPSHVNDDFVRNSSHYHGRYFDHHGGHMGLGAGRIESFNGYENNIDQGRMQNYGGPQGSDRRGHGGFRGGFKAQWQHQGMDYPGDSYDYDDSQDNFRSRTFRRQPGGQLRGDGMNQFQGQGQTLWHGKGYMGRQLEGYGRGVESLEWQGLEY